VVGSSVNLARAYLATGSHGPCRACQAVLVLSVRARLDG